MIPSDPATVPKSAAQLAATLAGVALPTGPVAPLLRQAVALSYRSDEAAPRVSAQGRGLVAEEIIRRAREAGVYVHQSTELVSMLMGLDLDQHIPERLYVVVAELLAWLHRTDQEGRPAGPPASGIMRPGP